MNSKKKIGLYLRKGIELHDECIAESNFGFVF